MIRLIAFCLLAFSLSGCTSILTLQAVANTGQEIIYQNDIESVISKKESIVIISPESRSYQSDKRPTLVVSVFNGSQSTFNFGTDNIQVFVNGIPVKVYTYDELASEIKQQQAWAAVAVAMNGATQTMNAANAGYTYHSGTYNSSYNNNYGDNISGKGSYSGYSYNSAQAQQAQAVANAQTQANMAAISANANQAISSLSRTILRKSTVLPNSWHGGFIKLEKIPIAEGTNEVLVNVIVGKELHAFRVLQQKLK